MRKLLLVTTVIVSAFCVAACGGGSGAAGILPGAGSPNTSTPPNYYPATVGSKWTYRNTSSNNSTSTWTEEITQGNATSYSVKITNPATTTYSIMDATLTNGAWGMSKITSYGGSGSVLNTITISPPQLFFPSKTDIGTHESRTSTLTSGGNNSQVQVTLDVTGIESVAVPAGTFANALKITTSTTTNGNTGTMTAWYADAVGFVKSVDGYGGTQELTSYAMH